MSNYEARAWEKLIAHEQSRRGSVRTRVTEKLSGALTGAASSIDGHFRKLPGGDKWHTVSLAPSSFKTVDGKDSMASWNHADLLGFRAYYGNHREATIGTTRWSGPRPTFRNLRWARPRD